MLRLFDRGHNTEGRCAEFLKAAGFTVYDVDPTTGKQFLFSDVSGHYGGSCDGLATHATYFPNEGIVCEYKTHNNKSFAKLLKAGVRIAKPRHFAQHSTYGKRFGCRMGVYVAINKDNDQIHLEFVELDWSLADSYTEVARVIITSQIPPQRMKNASPSFFACKNCEHMGTCFYRQTPDKNCRSCHFARPDENATWFCDNYHQTIPAEVIAKGCDVWRSIL